MRYVGEPVVAVAAESGEVADEALSLCAYATGSSRWRPPWTKRWPRTPRCSHDTNALVGEYHEMAAVEEEAPRNVCHHERLEDGDVRRGF